MALAAITPRLCHDDMKGAMKGNQMRLPFLKSIIEKFSVFAKQRRGQNGMPQRSRNPRPICVEVACQGPFYLIQTLEQDSVSANLEKC